jgi:hypothetical protein
VGALKKKTDYDEDEGNVSASLENDLQKAFYHLSKMTKNYNLTISTEKPKVIVQGEHKRALHFQNGTENKCGVLRTSHLHQSIEKLSKFCTHFTETRYVLRESHGRCRDDNPTRTAKSSGFRALTN